jgi:hypothetical protein
VLPSTPATVARASAHCAAAVRRASSGVAMVMASSGRGPKISISCGGEIGEADRRPLRHQRREGDDHQAKATIAGLKGFWPRPP